MMCYPIHESFSRWTHKSTVVASVVGVLRGEGVDERVAVLTQSLLFICKDTGDVERTVKLGTITVISVMGEQVVFAVGGEEDLHLTLVEDDRNITSSTQLPYIVKDLVEALGGEVVVRDVPEPVDTPPKTPPLPNNNKPCPSPNSAPEGYLEWLAEQRKEGARLSAELNQAILGLGTVPELTPLKRSCTVVSYEVPEIRESEVESGTTTPPSYCGGKGGGAEDLWGVLLEKLSEQGANIDDLRSASDDALLGVFQELRFSAVHCAVLQSEWKRRRTSTATSTPPWTLINTMLHDLVQGGRKTLETIDPLPPSTTFNPSSLPTTLLWHTHDVLAAVPGPLGTAVYFPATPITAEYLGEGLHVLTLSEVILGDILEVTTPDPGLTLAGTRYGSVKLTLPTEKVYAVQDVERVMRKWRVAFFVELEKGENGVERDAKHIRENAEKQKEVLRGLEEAAKEELARYRKAAEEELEKKSEQLLQSLHAARGRAHRVHSTLTSNLISLQHAVSSKDRSSTATACSDIRDALSLPAPYPQPLLLPTIHANPLPSDIFYTTTTTTTTIPTECVHITDFDANGVFHYLGTSCSREPFENPVLRGLVNITMAGGVHPRSNRDAQCIVGGERGHFFMTSDCVDGWLEVHLTQHKLQPSAYTLEHGVKGSDALSLRNWVLEASNDQNHWSTLASHSNDVHLGAASASHTWVLAPGAGSDSYFSHFRIRSTGPCANSTSWSICLAGIELYGSLVES